MILTDKKKVREYRAPFIAALLCGLAAHMFVFTNKLMNADEVDSLFGKGATVTSGRWGLELVRLVFPSQSMPWLYGLISLLLFAVSACLILELFEIKGKLIRCLFAAMVCVFPSLTGTFCFMFTSSAYALSFFMAVLAVCLFVGNKSVGRRLLCGLLLLLSLGIYQSYISLVASLFVLAVFKTCLDGENSLKKLFLQALDYLSLMFAALTLYLVVTLLVLRFTGSEYNFYVRQNVYGEDNAVSILGRIRMAYDFFTYYFSYREFALITGEASRVCHIVLMGVSLVGVGGAMIKMLKEKKLFAAAGMTAAVVLLPLAINCLFLAFAKEAVHSLMIYSFVSLYALAAMLTERVFGTKRGRAARDIVYACLTLAIVSNIYFANAIYLKLHLQYENAYSFYSILLSRVEKTEGFDESCRLAMIGDQDNTLHQIPQIDAGYLQGPSYDLVNIYSREKFFRYYLGTTIPFADKETVEKLKTDERFLAMNEYPYDGSVKKIDDCIVVKLG